MSPTRFAMSKGKSYCLHVNCLSLCQVYRKNTVNPLTENHTILIISKYIWPTAGLAIQQYLTGFKVKTEKRQRKPNIQTSRRLVESIKILFSIPGVLNIEVTCVQSLFGNDSFFSFPFTRNTPGIWLESYFALSKFKMAEYEGWEAAGYRK